MDFVGELRIHRGKLTLGFASRVGEDIETGIDIGECSDALVRVITGFNDLLPFGGQFSFQFIQIGNSRLGGRGLGDEIFELNYLRRVFVFLDY